MSSNPAPRPALARTATGPVRPPLRRPDSAAPPPAEPAPEPVAAEESPAKAGTKPDGKSKKAKHGHKDGRDYKDHRGAKNPETVELTVTLTKLSRRALKDAAGERDMTPEELASLVLSAWLDR